MAALFNFLFLFTFTFLVNKVWQHGDCGNPLCEDNPNCDFKALPLFAAIVGDHPDVVALLLQQPDINVNLELFEMTALNLAVMLQRYGIITQLIAFPGTDLEGTPFTDADSLQALKYVRQLKNQENMSYAASEIRRYVKQTDKQEQLRKKQEMKKIGEKRREEELSQRKQIEREKEAEKKRLEEEKKKEEEKRKIGRGKGRNARKRKSEEQRRHKAQDGQNNVLEQSNGLEEKELDLVGNTTNVKTMDSKDVAKNRSLVDFLDRQILKLEEELECPVCLEVATTAPIYKCPEDHLICRLPIKENSMQFHIQPFCRICRPKLSECPQCRVALDATFHSV